MTVIKHEFPLEQSYTDATADGLVASNRLNTVIIAVKGKRDAPTCIYIIH